MIREGIAAAEKKGHIGTIIDWKGELLKLFNIKMIRQKYYNWLKTYFTMEESKKNITTS